jgi:pyrroline-5-carboxylate reductase
MFARTIGFVGAGRIARILLEGWQRAGLEFSSIVASDPDATALGRLPKLSRRLTCVAGDNAAAARQDIVLLAVHPPALPEVVAAIRTHVRPEAVVVSLAPKFTIAKLAELLGGFQRIARTIPNAPSLLGQGFNPVAYAPALPAGERTLLQQLFAPLGANPEVAEKTLEAYAVISAMGPTYLWPQLIELCHLGQEFGLSPADALTAVDRMTSGAAATLADGGLTEEEVMNLVPVKPLGDAEAMFRDAYRTKLPAILEKIRP